MKPRVITVREACKSDALVLTELMNVLGYSTTVGDMEIRMNHILYHRDYKTKVAICEGEIVGMIGACRHLFYEQNGLYIRIVALVTLPAYRRCGIGHSLLQAIEYWGKSIGATSLLLNCGNREERKVAHDFYKRQGFTAKSTGYLKMLK